ncbi:TlpA family protein disulfide reductase, partial [Pseudoxanthomonas indica]
RFAQAQGEHGVQVVGLALDTPEGVREFLDKVPVRYPIVLDTPGPADASVWLGNAKGVLPYTVLVGADGRILKQKIGPFVEGEIDDWAHAAH